MSKRNLSLPLMRLHPPIKLLTYLWLLLTLFQTAQTRAKPTRHSTTALKRGVGQKQGQDIGAADTPVALVTRLPQTNQSLARLEYVMTQMVNAERAKVHLNALVFDSKLANVARAHSAEMRDRDYFAHQSPTPALRDPLDRYRAFFGTTPLIIAENIYRVWGSPHTPSENDIKTAHSALMNSPGHRENILRRGVTRIGIGIITNRNGDIWLTQMFSEP
ncbi:MAG: hypothetical protein JO316_03105 [Abitibacteriaceae bacterium]|nr:hypothetical protein [Abditibacteriaceae bacterium]